MVVLAMVYQDMPHDYEIALNVVNTVFVAIFCVEMVCPFLSHYVGCLITFESCLTFVCDSFDPFRF